jgi:hypothetical protein
VIAVAVHDQAGQTVGLGPDEAGERGVDRRVFPVVDGLADAAGEEVQIQVLLATGKPTSDDLRLWIINSGAERPVAEVLEGDDVTGLRIAEGFLDFGSVDRCRWRNEPRVKSSTIFP